MSQTQAEARNYVINEDADDSNQAILTYGMLTSPSPLEVSVANSKLSLVVSNPTSDFVQVFSISVTLPGPSQYAQDLTNSFVGIGVQVPTDNTGKPLWTSTQTDGVFVLKPVSEEVGKIGGQGLPFLFTGIKVNDSVGSCYVDIMEDASSSSLPRASRPAPAIQVQKWPAQFSMSQPTADPISVTYGGKVTLGWLVSGAGVTCFLKYDPAGSGIKEVPVPMSGPFAVEDALTNPNNVVFTLEAHVTDPGQPRPMIYQKQITVTVIPNPTIDFDIAANPLVPGQPVTFVLSWNLSDISNFQISANDGPNSNPRILPVSITPKGSYNDAPHALNVTYTLTALATAAEDVASRAG